MRYEPADLFFAAGEASGDLEASLLAAAARARRPALTLGGIGGERLAQAGTALMYDSTELASIGPLSIVPKLPRLYALLHGLARAMLARPVGVFVPVDAGAFNLRLARLLRDGGYRAPIVYYFPPGAWLDNLDQARAVAALTTPLTPFAHQRDFYQRHGLRAAYFGHPLVSVIEARPAKPLAQVPRIAVLPGSRKEEVAHHAGILARAAAELARRHPCSFVAVASSDARASQIEALWKKARGPLELAIARGGVVAALRGADLAWVASGTAVLEAALVGVPQICFYVVSKMQYQIALRRLPAHILRSIALPNLVLGREVIPELLQDQFTVERLVGLTRTLLENDEVRLAQRAGADELRAALGPPDTLDRIATFTLEQLPALAAT